MPQFSRWTRPQRRGLLFLALVFVVGHFLLFFVSQEQQHFYTPCLIILSPSGTPYSSNRRRKTPSIPLTPIDFQHGMPTAWICQSP